MTGGWFMALFYPHDWEYHGNIMEIPREYDEIEQRQQRL
jgi:hypothetical protein